MKHSIDPKIRICRNCHAHEVEILANRLPCLSEKGKLHKRVENDLSYHVPNVLGRDKLELNRAQFKLLAHFLVENCPLGRELSEALTCLQQSAMWANCSLVVNQE